MSDIKRRIEGINDMVATLVEECLHSATGSTEPIGRFLLDNYTVAMECGRTDLARYIGRTWPSVRGDYTRARRAAA